jgi:hypothetical protein
LWKEVLISGVAAVGLAHPTYGLVPQEAKIDQTQGTATSQQVSSDDAARTANALHKLDERQLDQSVHQLGHVYSADVLKQAEEQKRRAVEGDAND